jgi:hypothetical protein
MTTLELNNHDKRSTIMAAKKIKPEITEALLAAAIDCLALSEDRYYPSGKTDSGQRWYPSEAEQCPDCASVRSPSRAYPWSYWKHCRTYKHVCARHGVSVSEAKQLAAWIAQIPEHIRRPMLTLEHPTMQVIVKRARGETVEPIELKPFLTSEEHSIREWALQQLAA